ncbi:MAG: MOSC domain-containing protein [Methanocella sp.]
MPHVAALYRYPVKGFTAESCDTLTVLADGRVAGDRVLGFRFANCRADDHEWSTKHEFVALVNTPGLARLNVRYDHARRMLRIASDRTVLAEEALHGEGRTRLASVVQEYVVGLADHPLMDHPERLPLRLVGDGVTPRFQDNAAGHTTLHGRASLAALAAYMGVPDVNEVRFRSNVAVEGLAAWDEHCWLGRRVRIGSV